MTTKIALPQTDILIHVPECAYVHPVSRDTYKSLAFDARCSTGLVHTGKNYGNSLALVPEGFRMSDLEEISYLIQLEEQLKKEGKSPREALNDPVFERSMKSPYRWGWTHRAFSAPKGKDKLSAYTEKDAQGRAYVRADMLRGDTIIAEDVAVPVSHGGKVVEWNTALRIPAIVSEGTEPDHTAHHWLNTELQEAAVVLGDCWHRDGRGRCLGFGAVFGRSGAGSGGAFRLFEGSLDGLPVPSVERFVKDRESYERGLVDGEKAGLEKARKEFATDIRELKLLELLERYK